MAIKALNDTGLKTLATAIKNYVTGRLNAVVKTVSDVQNDVSKLDTKVTELSKTPDSGMRQWLSDFGNTLLGYYDDGAPTAQTVVDAIENTDNLMKEDGAFGTTTQARFNVKSWLADFMEGYDHTDGTDGATEGEKVRNAVLAIDSLQKIAVRNMTSVSNITVNGYSHIFATISASASLSLRTSIIPGAGQRTHIIIYNKSGSQITVTLPSTNTSIRIKNPTVVIPGLQFGVLEAISDGTYIYLID